MLNLSLGYVMFVSIKNYICKNFVCRMCVRWLASDANIRWCKLCLLYYQGFCLIIADLQCNIRKIILRFLSLSESSFVDFPVTVM